MPNPHLSVQIAHAAIAATLAYGNHRQPHPYLVVCGVENESRLEAAFERLKASGVPCCAWREDDMGNSLTAVATAPLTGNERRPLRRFDLLK